MKLVYNYNITTSLTVTLTSDFCYLNAHRYALFGEIVSEYNAYWKLDTIPSFCFNGKQFDEETGMYYYETRYYNPPTFISRDPLFEKYFWCSPYCYTANNPVKYVDPTGMEFDPTEDKKYVQPMEKDIQARLSEIRTSMNGLEKGSDEYNRLNDHATELSNALTEISALRADQNNMYKINFGGSDFKKEAGGGYSDAAGSLTYGGVNENGQNVVNINIKEKYAGTTGIMLHEFKHADQYRMGNLGFYIDKAGNQVDVSNNREIEKQANYRGDVYSFGRTTPAYNNYNLQSYDNLKYNNIAPTGQYHGYARRNGWQYITNQK
jgi:RHS repeat-associated protein